MRLKRSLIHVLFIHKELTRFSLSRGGLENEVARLLSNLLLQPRDQRRDLCLFANACGEGGVEDLARVTACGRGGRGAQRRGEVTPFFEVASSTLDRIFGTCEHNSKALCFAAVVNSVLSGVACEAVSPRENQ